MTVFDIPEIFPYPIIFALGTSIHDILLGTCRV